MVIGVPHRELTPMDECRASADPPIIRGWLGAVGLANGHGGETPRESVDPG
jgi:hypothetical protein